jgi:hypothetical protein
LNYTELEQYLINVSDSDFVELVKVVNRLFEHFDVENWTHEAGSIILENSDATDTQTLDNIKATITALVIWLLTVHGITLTDDSLLSEKVEILNSVKVINDYSDITAIENILETDKTNEEKVSDIFQLVSIFNTDKILSLLTNVDDRLLNNLTLLTQPDTTELYDTAKEVEKQITAYIKFKIKLQDTDLYSDQYFNSLPVIGLDFELYVTSYSKELPMFEDGNLDENQISLDLIGLSLLSKEFETPITLTRKYMHLITNDVNQSTRLDNLILKQQIELGN